MERVSSTEPVDGSSSRFETATGLLAVFGRTRTYPADSSKGARQSADTLYDFPNASQTYLDSNRHLFDIIGLAHTPLAALEERRIQRRATSETRMCESIAPARTMPQRNAEFACVEEHAIKGLLDAWALWRDTGRFAELRACYAPDATMVTTWFDGRAADFVDASIRASGSATLVQHFIGPSTIEVEGLRAIAETRLMILIRTELTGVEIDVTCYGRFFDRLVRLDGDWRILSRMPIYEKDRLAAVNPSQAVDLDPVRLRTYPPAFRHLAYVQASSGATITTTIPEHNSDAQRELYSAGKAWLHGT